MHASYEASYLIAKSSKPLSVGEKLVLHAAVKMSEIIHGKKYGDEIGKIPLSNDTVYKRTHELLITNRSSQSCVLRKIQCLLFGWTKPQMYQKKHNCYFTFGMFMKKALKKKCFFVDL